MEIILISMINFLSFDKFFLFSAFVLFCLPNLHLGPCILLSTGPRIVLSCWLPVSSDRCSQMLCASLIALSGGLCILAVCSVVVVLVPIAVHWDGLLGVFIREINGVRSGPVRSYVQNIQFTSVNSQNDFCCQDKKFH